MNTKYTKASAKESGKDTRLVARVSEDVQSTIYKAAAYSGATVTQFLVESALDKAKAVIDEVETIQLSEKATAHMMALINNPPEPNDYLKKAKANYEKSIKHAADHTAE